MLSAGVKLVLRLLSTMQRRRKRREESEGDETCAETCADEEPLLAASDQDRATRHRAALRSIEGTLDTDAKGQIIFRDAARPLSPRVLSATASATPTPQMHGCTVRVRVRARDVERAHRSRRACSTAASHLPLELGEPPRLVAGPAFKLPSSKTVDKVARPRKRTRAAADDGLLHVRGVATGLTELHHLAPRPPSACACGDACGDSTRKAAPRFLLELAHGCRAISILFEGTQAQRWRALVRLGEAYVVSELRPLAPPAAGFQSAQRVLAATAKTCIWLHITGQPNSFPTLSASASPSQGASRLELSNLTLGMLPPPSLGLDVPSLAASQQRRPHLASPLASATQPAASATQPASGAASLPQTQLDAALQPTQLDVPLQCTTPSSPLASSQRSRRDAPPHLTLADRPMCSWTLGTQLTSTQEATQLSANLPVSQHPQTPPLLSEHCQGNTQLESQLGGTAGAALAEEALLLAGSTALDSVAARLPASTEHSRTRMHLREVSQAADSVVQSDPAACLVSQMSASSLTSTPPPRRWRAALRRL